MLSFIGNLFQNADFVGSPININYKGQTTVKTAFGGILTALSIILTFLLTYLYIIPFIQRPIPRISFNFSKEINPSQSYLNLTQFFLAVNLINPNPLLKKELSKYVQIKISNMIEKEMNNTRDLTLNQINLFDYDTSKISDTLKSDYSLSLISNKRLLSGSKVANLEGLYFQGSSVNELYSYLNIKLELDLDTMVKDYGSFQAARSYAVNTLFADSSFAMIYSDLNTKLENYTNPVDKFLSFFQAELNFDLLQNVESSFVSNQIVLDNNYIVDEEIDTRFYLMHYLNTIYPKKIYSANSNDLSLSYANVSNSNTNILGDVQNTRTLMDIDISKIKYFYYYRRYYAKLTEILSSLGGSVILFYYLLFILGKYIIDFQMQSKLIKLLYDIDFDEYEEDPELKAKNQRKQIQKRMDIKNIHFAVKNYIKILEKKQEEEYRKKPLQDAISKRAKKVKNQVHNEKDEYIINYVHEKFEINEETQVPGNRENTGNFNNNDIINENNINENATMRTDNRMMSNLVGNRNLNGNETKNNYYNNTEDKLKIAGNPLDENKQKMIEQMKLKNKEKKRPIKKPKSDDVFVDSSSFNIFDCLIYFFEHQICRKSSFTNKKVTLYDKAKKEMSKNIAINNIVGKFYEIDLLKYFIFNKDQINLFKLITMPQITDLDYLNKAEFEKIIDNYRNFELKKDSEFRENIFDDLNGNKYGEVMKSYRNMLDKLKKTVIDNKILKCIEKNVIEFVNYSDNLKNV